MLKLKKYSGGEQFVQILKKNWEKNLTEKWDQSFIGNRREAEAEVKVAGVGVYVI